MWRKAFSISHDTILQFYAAMDTTGSTRMLWELRLVCFDCCMFRPLSSTLRLIHFVSARFHIFIPPTNTMAYYSDDYDSDDEQPLSDDVLGEAGLLVKKGQATERMDRSIRKLAEMLVCPLCNKVCFGGVT